MSAPPLRRHLRLALGALARHWEDGHTRAWVELPPGRARPGWRWHAVPAAAGRNRRRAAAYARGWSTWVSGGDAVAAGSPEGVGALTAQAGSDPLGLAATVRSQWN